MDAWPALRKRDERGRGGDSSSSVHRQTHWGNTHPSAHRHSDVHECFTCKAFCRTFFSQPHYSLFSFCLSIIPHALLLSFTPSLPTCPHHVCFSLSVFHFVLTPSLPLCLSPPEVIEGKRGAADYWISIMSVYFMFSWVSCVFRLSHGLLLPALYHFASLLSLYSKVYSNFKDDKGLFVYQCSGVHGFKSRFYTNEQTIFLFCLNILNYSSGN